MFLSTIGVSSSSTSRASAAAGSTRAANPSIVAGQQPSRTTESLIDLRREYRAIVQFREVLQVFRADMRLLSGLGSGTTTRTVSSNSPIGLETNATWTTLESSDEINTITTSYSPTQPSFSGSSTAVPTISGVYSGASNDVLTFNVSHPGQLSSNVSKEMTVTNQSGAVIDTLTIPGNYTAGTVISLSNGLGLSFADGFLSNNDSFQVTVLAGVDNAVNADNSLNGSGTSAPGFEPGVSVVAGSFTVNGETITVAASDSINSVLAKISSSGAGVSASFDSARERVVLVSTTAGSSGTVDLANDTSGFLQAVRLDTASPIIGLDDDLNRTMDDVAAFQSVTAGEFTIDSTSVSQDPAQDSLADVLTRINGSVSSLSIEYLESSDMVRLNRSGDTTQTMLDDGGTGFFSSLKITTGTRLFLSGSRRSTSNLRQITEAVSGLAGDLNKLVAGASSTTFASQLRTTLLESVRTSIPFAQTSATRTLAGFGLKLDGRAQTESFLTVDESSLNNALRRRGDTFINLLLNGAGTNSSPGVIADLDAALSTEQRSLQDTITASGGSVIDLLA